MDFHLRVREQFGTYSRGDNITDATEVARVLASEQHVHVIRVAADPPAPEPEPVKQGE